MSPDIAECTLGGKLNFDWNLVYIFIFIFKLLYVFMFMNSLFNVHFS